MPRKAIDGRIPTLIKNGVQEKKRSIFVVVGDRGRDQVVNLHWLLSQSQVASRPNVLWMYKKDLLGFTSHRKKREQKIKKDIKRGIRDANDAQDPFELFIAVTNIRYTYYKESEKILGQTFGMCVLQDFEALTPNLLARTIETVEGGGIIVILLKTMTSLKQLYTMTMDVHSRYRTEGRHDVTARFNERFILSLAACQHALVVDDELNVLPVSGAKDVTALPPTMGDEVTKEQSQLKELKRETEERQPAGALVSVTRTLDQGKAVLAFCEAVGEKTLRSTVTLTAGRGRGKSAAMGLAVASAVAYGYSNIFITSPTPENLKTLFEFVFKGFDSLQYAEHLDYEIIQSTNPDFNKAIVRVNVFRGHRQTIQYIRPEDSHVLGQAELVVIDEAAAIPLPLVQKLIGPYLVFMASTINGYEGTGRSLSLKLVQQLREQSRGFIGQRDKALDVVDEVVDRAGKSAGKPTLGGRTLRELQLKEPIRYANGDPIEAWLNKLLCLDVSASTNRFPQGCPHPSECQLFAVNRDTLFSFHPVSETFLQRMMALYVSSHYKNSPNDLQLMSDAPAHQLFVLLPPVKESDRGLPEPLCVVQIALEGQISRQSVLNNLARGVRAGGDLIPWLVSQQFQDEGFASLSGARVVRIATNPEYTRMGYGRRALELLHEWYSGKLTNLDESEVVKEDTVRVSDAELANVSLQTETLQVRDARKMPPLLLKLSEKRPEVLDYVGVSYGMTPSLFKFWKRAGYAPVYLRQTPNDLTGEHSCVMVRALESSNEWLAAFAGDFRKRFMSLLSYQFAKFSGITALSIVEAVDAVAPSSRKPLAKAELDVVFSPFDLKRLESYSNNLLDHHVVVDLLPTIATLYFSGRFSSEVKLSGVQSCILLGLGLQHKVIEDLEKELNLPASQLLAMLTKVVRKISTHLREVQKAAYTAELPDEDERVLTLEHEETVTNGKNVFKPLTQTLEEDLEEGADEVRREQREKQREFIDALDLTQYAVVDGTQDDWQQAEAQIKKGGATQVGVRGAASTDKRGIAQEILDKEDKHRQKKRGKKEKARS
ncbi:N-acetyltransferase 10 [Savitreella phatthalungensis]